MNDSRRTWVLLSLGWGLFATLVHSQLRGAAGDIPLRYVDAVGFAVFVPAFVLLGAVMLPTFEFVRYRRHRGKVGMATDFVLVVTGGLIGGLAGGALAAALSLGGTATVTLVAVGVYAAGFAAFTARNTEYYDRHRSMVPNSL